MSLRDKIFAWLKKQPGVWVSGVAIEKVVMQNTKHGGSTAARECRRLALDGQIERQERSWNGKMLAWYRYNPETNTDEMIKRDLDWFDNL